MKNFAFLFFSATICALLCGCGKEHKAPPLERNQLVTRFFNSLSNNKPEAAAMQGRKLMALDPSNENIILLIEIQESNATVFKAQKEINSGNIDRAVETLNEGIDKYPDNSSLIRLRAQVRQLRHAKKLLDGMEIVNTPESMSSALTAATTGLAANISPKLDKYFKDYEKRIDAAEAAAKAEKKKAASAPEAKSDK